MSFEHSEPVNKIILAADKDFRRKFWIKVFERGDCFTFCGKLDRFGYGKFLIGRQPVSAHHIALLWSKKAPTEKCTHAVHMPRCQNRACVRPIHLFWGTWLQKEREDQRCVAGVRFNRAPHAPGAKLTEADVRRMWKLRMETGMTYAELAEEFGVCGAIVSPIFLRKAWAHCTADLPDIDTWRNRLGKRRQRA